MRKTTRGIPLFEHAVVALVAGLAIWGAYTCIDLVLEQAEASVVAATVMNIRSGMRHEKARRILQGQPGAIAAGSNPLSFLRQPPAGYQGAETDDEEAGLGTWFYQEGAQTLYYLPRYRSRLQWKGDGNHGPLGWKIMEVPDRPKEIDLVSVTPYKWF